MLDDDKNVVTHIHKRQDAIDLFTEVSLVSLNFSIQLRTSKNSVSIDSLIDKGIDALVRMSQSSNHGGL